MIGRNWSPEKDSKRSNVNKEKKKPSRKSTVNLPPRSRKTTNSQTTLRGIPMIKTSYRVTLRLWGPIKVRKICVQVEGLPVLL